MKLTYTQKLHIAGYALALGVAGISTCGEIRGCQQKEATREAHEARVVQTYERLKPCPDLNDALQGCYEQKARAAMFAQAEADKSAGRFEDAGRAFARLGEEDRASEMAGRCHLANDSAGEGRILEEIAVMKEALRRYSAAGLGKTGNRVDLGDVGTERDADAHDVSEEDDAGSEEISVPDAVESEGDEATEALEESGEAVEDVDAGVLDAEPEAVDVEPESADASPVFDAVEESDENADEADARRGRDAGRRRDGMTRDAVAEAATDREAIGADAAPARDASAAREVSAASDAVADAPARESRGRPISW